MDTTKPRVTHPHTKWIAFFSQTGSEIAKLSTLIGRRPIHIVTDNPNRDEWHPDIQNHRNVEIFVKPIKPDMYHEVISHVVGHAKGLPSAWFCTLHGWLNIIPKVICESYPENFFNGHPGQIIRYTHLKGKDPQQKVIDNFERRKYLFVGSVVHKITPEVDGGEVLYYDECFLPDGRPETVFRLCQQTSLIAWDKFFNNYNK